MPPIQTLSDSLINKIAAGEVIERPASVVKELVENSLDAKAMTIDIEIDHGGKKSILVRDNGEGIAPGELALAISRHTTSKIVSPDDLFRIETLGFRGEALASIAAVSHLTLISRLRDGASTAREIKLEGGRVISEGEAGHPPGTSVLVKYLFFQTPARLKFLKGTETEVTHTVEHVTRAALVNPQVAFRLTHQGRVLIDLEPNQELPRRIEALFGREVSLQSYPISVGRDGIEIDGLVGHPQISRSHQRHVYLFVNGRPVKDRILFHAVMEAHRNLLMRGRYPFVVLYLKLPHMMVDVNVHPTKAEVRFSNSSIVHRIVFEAVRAKLESQPWLGAQRGGTGDEEKRSTESEGDGGGEGITGDRALWIEGSRGEGAESDSFQRKIEFGRTPYSELEVVGQLMATYILCVAKDRFVLVDQHAAHERIGFEKLLLQYSRGSIAAQSLLIPENFDLNPSETEILKEFLDELRPFGFEIDFFGGHTFVTKAHPALFKRRVPPKALMLDLIGDLLEKGGLTSLKDNLNAVLARMACHQAIRAHDPLTQPEMRALLSELDDYHNTSFCPHGRPISVEVTRGEIEKWFKRVL